MSKIKREINHKTIKMFKKIVKLLLPPEKMTVDEWADKYRVLTSESAKETGQWETMRTPYMVEIYKNITNKELRQLTLMLAAQLAKSELIINTFGRYVHLDPCPMLLVQPTDNMAAKFSKERLEPAIRECKVLRESIKAASKRGGDTVMHKMFLGGFVACIGTNSPTNLAARPIRMAFMDEVDRYAGSSGKEGSPITLVKKRLATYEEISKCIVTGTPTVKDSSAIESEYKNSSQAEWHLRCPKCNQLHVLKFPNLKWEEDKPATVKMKCDYCGELSTEKEWKRNNQATGEWIHKYPERKDHLGYHLSGLASVFRSWENIVKEFIEIKGDKEKLKAFINTVLAETWEDDVASKIDYEKLYKRRRKYEAELPEDVLLLTAGIDVQGDWLAIEVVGWGLNKIYGIEFKIIRGNLESDETWEMLDLYLKREFKFKDGKGLNIYAACIDTGGSHTQKSYEFIEPRQYRRIIGIKGQGGDAVPVNNGFRPTTQDFKKGKRISIQLLSVGVNALKDLNYGNLTLKNEDGEYYCKFPSNQGRGYDLDYFMGLTSEVKSYKNKKVEWVKIRERNEPLDCRNYATVPLYIFDFDFEALTVLTREQLSKLSKQGVLKSEISKQRTKVEYDEEY